MITRRIAYAIGLAVSFTFLVSGLRMAGQQGWIDVDLAKRLVQVVIGLGLAGYANLMPKQIGAPGRSPLAEARVQRALRVGGWAMTLGGLAHAGLWAFAPLALAKTGSVIAVGAATLLTLSYALIAFTACHKAARQAPPQP